MEAPLLLPPQGGASMQLVVGAPAPDGTRAFSLRTRGTEGPFVQHVSGTLGATAAAPIRLDVWPPAGARPVEIDGLYARLADQGLGYGPAFQALEQVWIDDGVLYAEAALPDAAGADADGYGLHPALL